MRTLNEVKVDLASVPVITNSALPKGAFFCHPDTLTFDQDKLNEAVKRLDNMLRGG